MKRHILSLAGLLFAACAVSFAAPVGKAAARKIASDFLGCEVSDAPLESSSYFAFNGVRGGWIIISSDDCAVPILGYSLDGALEAPRSNVAAWLKGYDRAISAAVSAGAVQSETVARLWKTAGVRTKAAAETVLSTPSWDQESPYNLNCPKVTEGGRRYTALTGCVATAMSEVLRYHRWPEKGSGTIGGYTYTSDYDKSVEVQSYSIDSHSYDYSLMPYTYSGSESSAQKNAVAQLMHDCGVMVEAMYNYGSGTGAYSENIASALSEHMGYSKAAKLLYRQAYTDAQWASLIANEIDSDRPLIYAGNDSENGGHQFVCDGYNDSGYIHINWGWSGSSNGFFTLSLNISDAGYAFSQDQSMIVGLEPDRTSSSTLAGATLIFEYYDSSYSGLSLTSGSIDSGIFTLKAGYLLNTSYSLFGEQYNTISAYNGHLRAALVDYQLNLKEYISNPVSFSLAGGEMDCVSSISCTMSVEPDFSDRIVLMYETSDGSYEIVRGREGINYNERTGSYSYVNLTSYLPVVDDAAYIVVPTGLAASDKLYFELASDKQVSSLKWYFDGVQQSGLFVVLTSGEHTLRASVTYKNGRSENIYAPLVIQ